MTEHSQLEMVHRLPPAKLVDRFDYLSALRGEAGRARRASSTPAARSSTSGPARGSTSTWPTRRELVGIDIDEVGVSDARDRGYDAHAVDCRDVDAIRALGLAPADVVIAGEVIEHLDDPGGFLDGLHALLATDGVLIVTTPNASGLVNTFALLANYEVNHPDHVTCSPAARSTPCSPVTTGSRSSTACSSSR